MPRFNDTATAGRRNVDFVGTPRQQAYCAPEQQKATRRLERAGVGGGDAARIAVYETVLLPSASVILIRMP